MYRIPVWQENLAGALCKSKFEVAGISVPNAGFAIEEMLEESGWILPAGNFRLGSLRTIINTDNAYP